MSVTYWKMLGENIAKGLGEKTIRRLSTGGKFLGRTGAVVGIGFLVYELFKNYQTGYCSGCFYLLKVIFCSLAIII